MQIPPFPFLLRTTLAVGVILLALSGCAEGDFRPRAVGQEGEITVVIDSMRWKGEVGDALRETIGGYIMTLPAPERQFKLRPVNLDQKQDLDRVRRFKNILFVAPLTDSTNEALYLRNVFDESAQEAILSGRRAVISRQNLWMRDQQVYYITGANPQDVVESIRERAGEISGAFNKATRQRLHEDMFSKGRQPEIEKALMERHGFAVNGQHDYVIALDTTNYVWLRRILSDTWRSLFIHYQENAKPGDLTPSWIYSVRDSLTRIHMEGNVSGWVEIDYRRPLETEQIDFLGRYGFETRGLWHMVDRETGEMVELGMGGPFITYTFYDEPSGRIYMIDGAIFAPGFDKREFLRQMEVIAHTFRTRENTQRSAGVATR